MHASIVYASCMLNPRTKASQDWRAEQKRQGRIPKLIWVTLEEWEKVKVLLASIKKKRKN